jgi:hypothetical protein
MSLLIGQVPKRVIQGLDAADATGDCSMADFKGALEVMSRLGYQDAVEWLTDIPDQDAQRALYFVALHIMAICRENDFDL